MAVKSVHNDYYTQWNHPLNWISNSCLYQAHFLPTKSKCMETNCVVTSHWKEVRITAGCEKLLFFSPTSSPSTRGPQSLTDTVQIGPGTSECEGGDAFAKNEFVCVAARKSPRKKSSKNYPPFLFVHTCFQRLYICTCVHCGLSAAESLETAYTTTDFDSSCSYTSPKYK